MVYVSLGLICPEINIQTVHCCVCRRASCCLSVCVFSFLILVSDPEAEDGNIVVSEDLEMLNKWTLEC